MVICCNVVKTTGMEGGLRVLGDAVGHAGEPPPEIPSSKRGLKGWSRPLRETQRGYLHSLPAWVYPPTQAAATCLPHLTEGRYLFRRQGCLVVTAMFVHRSFKAFCICAPIPPEEDMMSGVKSASSTTRTRSS